MKKGYRRVSIIITRIPVVSKLSSFPGEYCGSEDTPGNHMAQPLSEGLIGILFIVFSSFFDDSSVIFLGFEGIYIV